MKYFIMKVYIFLLSFIATVYLNSCSGNRLRQTSQNKLGNRFLRENETVNPILKGYWKSIGNGYILDATSDSILLYSYTKNFCYKEKNDYIEGLLNSKARFILNNDTLSIFSTDYGDKSSVLQIKRDYVRIKNLPDNHLSFSQMQKLEPKKLFNLFIETYSENYAFSKERGINWDSIKAEFESQISDKTTESELFHVFGQIVTRTKDQHTKVIDVTGQTMQYRITPSAEIVSEVFRSQSNIKKLDDYFNLFFNTNYKNISDSLLHGKGHKVANGKLEWGSLNNNIGYINIHSFDGFVTKSHSRKQQIDSVNYHMENIIKNLQNKKAIIIDISFNFGGYDASSLTLASYFTEKPLFAYISQVYFGGMFYNESKVYIQPSNKVRFTKPVYILMTDISRSQAEGFAMTMKANSNVKLVGTNTLGILSSMLGKSIGNFYCTLSNQRLIMPNGKYYEVTGVEPDIKMTVFNKQNIFNGHKDSINKIVEIIESN